MKLGSVASGVGVGLAGAIGDKPGEGEAVVDGELLGLGAGEGLTAEVELQAARATATALAAQDRGNRRGIVLQRENTPMPCRPTICYDALKAYAIRSERKREFGPDGAGRCSPAAP
jgi:hypothetical protein